MTYKQLKKIKINIPQKAIYDDTELKNLNKILKLSKKICYNENILFQPCPICFDEFLEKNKKYVYITKCGHIFCKDCIKNIEINYKNNIFYIYFVKIHIKHKLNSNFSKFYNVIIVTSTVFPIVDIIVAFPMINTKSKKELKYITR